MDMPLRVAIARIVPGICLASLALPAAAAHLEIQGGRSYMDSFASNAAFVESVFDDHYFGSSRFSWAPDASLGWINGRDLAHYRYSNPSTTDDAWILAGGVRFHYGDANRWYRQLFFSFQLALQSAHTQALSSPYEFVSTLGWQGRHFSFQIRHISNADLREPNRGETMALVGVGFDL
ncbi:MAG: acyloxyacyl hydrolase [Rhodanobacter sp.]